jgi:hypothetical protein
LECEDERIKELRGKSRKEVEKTAPRVNVRD